MEIKVSDIVTAVRGRDAGENFFVIKTENGFAYIANGTTRRIEKPKKKKFCHLRRTDICGGDAAEKLTAGIKVTNREIRRALSGTREAPQEAQGGM